MKLYAAIMLGGAAGSAMRYAASTWVDERFPTGFPWGTVAVNITGSFLIGVLAVLLGIGGPLPATGTLRAFLIIGVLGGFTTFSSFSLQTISLWSEGRSLWAAGNVLLSVGACLVGTAAGVTLARALTARG